MFNAGSTRSSHYVKTSLGSRHDSDIARLEKGHKAHMDLGKNTAPGIDSHMPNQDNYEGGDKKDGEKSISPLA
jgi:hypothetical protein